MKKNKKGFTLAELLIVVAIIAVLTAIAVPLFVTSLSKAKANVKDANIRAVRVAAVAHILDSADPNGTESASAKDAVSADGVWVATAAGKDSWELKGPWEVVAEINASGDITSITIIYKADASTNTCEEVSGGGYKVTCTVTMTNVEAYKAPSAGGGGGGGLGG